MNPGSTRIYAPVLRGPLLFHQNTAHSVPTYNATRPVTASSASSIMLPSPSPYTRPARSKLQAPLPTHPQFYPQTYPYYSALPRSTFPSPQPYSYTVSNAAFMPTDASSNGLALILVATLILVALDLLIVRPQKSRC